jgi:hypothetical protein
VAFHALNLVWRSAKVALKRISFSWGTVAALLLVPFGSDAQVPMALLAGFLVSRRVHGLLHEGPFRPPPNTPADRNMVLGLSLGGAIYTYVLMLAQSLLPLLWTDSYRFQYEWHQVFASALPAIPAYAGMAGLLGVAGSRASRSRWGSLFLMLASLPFANGWYQLLRTWFRLNDPVFISHWIGWSKTFNVLNGTFAAWSFSVTALMLSTFIERTDDQTSPFKALQERAQMPEPELEPEPEIPVPVVEPVAEPVAESIAALTAEITPVVEVVSEPVAEVEPNSLPQPDRVRE